MRETRITVRFAGKWFGLLLCIAITGAWAMSWIRPYHFVVGTSHYINVDTGDVLLIVINTKKWYDPKDREYKAWVWTNKDSVTQLPIFVVWFLAVLLTVLLFWLDRRRIPAGHCQCGYNLTGNTSGLCPECGTAITDEVKDEIKAPPVDGPVA